MPTTGRIPVGTFSSQDLRGVWPDLTSESYPVAMEVSSEGDDRKERTMKKMLLWWSLAAVVGWILLPASLESLSVALGGLAADLRVPPLPPGDALKLVGGVALLAAMWRWTTPGSMRGRGLHRRR
jgi:hypothetical protein